MHRKVDDGFQLDIPKLHSYLSIMKVASFTDTQLHHMTYEQFTGGQSNPTYLLSIITSSHVPYKCVLRKQPPGIILPGAHQIIREANIINSIHPYVPVPQILHICEDKTIIGTPFYIMQYLDGVIHKYPSLPNVPSNEREVIYHAAIDFLGKLHSININDIYSKSFISSGYNTRQISIWSLQHEKSVLVHKEPCSELDNLCGWLKLHVPEGDADGSYGGAGSRLVHGDFRIDNIVFDRANPTKILGVLDWELSSLGDPMTDIAYFTLPYHLPSIGILAPYSLLATDYFNVSSLGIPSESQILRQYRQIFLDGRRIPCITSKEWVFYLCIGLYRMACIASGIRARAVGGNAVGKQAVLFSSIIPVLAKSGIKLINTILEDVEKSVPRVIVIEFDLLIQRLKQFNDEIVIPSEKLIFEHYVNSEGVWPDRGTRWRRHSSISQMIAEARRRGLWNLWMPDTMANKLRSEFPRWEWSELLPHGQGFSNWQYMHLARESGRSSLTPLLINSSAPDTGNMEILALYGTSQQKVRWLLPLLSGSIRSCFGMTEPEVSSSDPTLLQSTAIQSEDKSKWIINGRKWWTTGACDELCKLCVFVARTGVDSEASHDRHSIFLIPFATRGVTVVRPLHVFGYDDAPQGHAEMSFEAVEVTTDSVLGQIGQGFRLMQARLGPGRLHHCARLIGHGERAIEEILYRGSSRQAFGKPLLALGSNMERLAQSRLLVERSFLLALNAASSLDSFHKSKNESDRFPPELFSDLAIVKVDVPRSMEECLDFAMQIHGGGGLTFDHPLAIMWTACRVLRIVDGPDEVHISTLGKLESKANPASRRSML